MEKSLTNFLLCGASIWRWISKKHMYKFHLNIKTCWSIILRECAFAFTFPLIGKGRKSCKHSFEANSKYVWLVTFRKNDERQMLWHSLLSSSLKRLFDYTIWPETFVTYLWNHLTIFFVSSLTKLQTAERYHNWRIQKEKLDL